MPDNELRNLLTELGDEGYYFGDTDANVRGGSFDERAHTGARPKASSSKIVYPNTVGEPGLREISAHPRGTRDKLFDIDARPTTAGEAKDVIRPLLEQGKKDFELGVIADTPRRSYINQQLVKKGVIEQGVDIFSANIDDATLKRAKPFLQSAELQEGAAKAFKTPEPEVIKQIRIQNMRKLAGKAAVAGVLGVSVLGTGASAAETKTRTDIASETGDIADKIQAGISGASLAADVASYSGIGAIPGTIASTTLDATNILIDQFRQGATHQRIRGRSGAQRALQAR